MDLPISGVHWVNLMRITYSFLLILVLHMALTLQSARAAAPGTADLMPLPSELTWQQGRLMIDSNLMITALGKSEPRVDSAIGRTRQRLRKIAPLAIAGAAGKTGALRPRLILSWTNGGLPAQSFTENESYTLTVTPAEARLTAENPLGILRGLETFLQLVETEGRRAYVPAVEIRDEPRFKWRGLLIDSCRHFQPLDVIKRNLDGMAAVKLNVLHWHLSEDQGFRVESKKFPRLHELGSDGNYYSQDQIREIIAYARDRGIRVIPEFDMPGHSTSWFVAYPEFASAPGPYSIERKYGIFDPCFDPTREEVYQFLDGFLGEMAALFPDQYLHIGGDEVNGKHWKQNARIQAFMSEHNLADNHDLQAYFTGRLLPILTRHGKRMVGWDEILHRELPQNIVVQSWRGPTALADAARRGYDGILSFGYYLDLALPASDHYPVDPVPAGSDLTPEQRSHILGGEACMWAELISTETIDSRIWPRAAAIAERLWSPGEVRDIDDMYRRLEYQSGRLELLGLTHRSNYPVMLQRIAGRQDIGSLKTLADVVEPVKNYARHDSSQYTQQTPLNRLVDAARPESDAARIFRKEVDAFLQNAPGFPRADAIRQKLTRWRDNHAALAPVLQSSDLGKEAIPVSKSLSSVAELGLQALDRLTSGAQANAAWQAGALEMLKTAQGLQAEVQIELIPAVRKLVLAASQLEKLKDMTPAEWNTMLDGQMQAARPKPD